MEKITEQFTTGYELREGYYYKMIDSVDSDEFYNSKLEEMNTIWIQKLLDVCNVALVFKSENSDYSDTIFIEPKDPNINPSDLVCLVHAFAPDECDRRAGNWLRLWWD